MRVAVIVMENHGYDSVVGLPYIRTIASSATALTDYHASAHPSLPNYLALTSGTTWGITDDGYHVLPAADVGDQLTAAGVPWRAYMEGMGADCRQGTGEYAVKHDPFAYYGGRCQPSVVPVAAADVRPRRCDAAALHLDHPQPLRRHARLLAERRRRLAAAHGAAAPGRAGDEQRRRLHHLGRERGRRLQPGPDLVLGARQPASPGAAYSHPSLLATVEDLLGVPRLAGHAGDRRRSRCADRRAGGDGMYAPASL